MPNIPLSEASTQPFIGERTGDHELSPSYDLMLHKGRIGWQTRYQLLRPLGAGGQGIVYLSERQGADGFCLPVALKVFSPECYCGTDDYEKDMRRIASVAARLAAIHHDGVLDIHNFIEQDGIRVMVMECVDGYDLDRLLTPKMLTSARLRLSTTQWDYLNEVIVTPGPTRLRLKPGIAIQVLRDCLAALGALHRCGIVHGDLKSTNIMLKRTGTAKIIDLGAAVELRRAAGRRFWSPVYAAPEVLMGNVSTPQSDLISLGYILIEMLAGQKPFANLTTYRDLLEAKRLLVDRLPELLPAEVVRSDLLMHLCQRLVAFEPAGRYPSAEAADLERKGAAAFHRQLVKGDLSSEYENDIRIWLEQLG